MSRNIAILFNPLSGKGDSPRSGEWLAAKLSFLGIPFELLSTPWPQNLERFTEVWIIGGDGTFHYFINQYPENELPIGLFRGGTGNDFVWSLYGNCTLAENFEKVWQSLPQRVDAGLCNDRFFVNSSGIGFDGEVLKSINQIRWLGGHLGYLSVVIQKIFSFRESAVRLLIDGKPQHGSYLLMIVNNSPRTGGGFLVTPKASLTDGRLDLMLCKPLPLLKRLRYLPVIEKGKHLSLPFIHYKQVKKVEIISEYALFAQLDGELIKASTFNYEIVPGKLLIKY